MITLRRDIPEPDAMRALARSLASLLRPGDVVGLSGDLGVGKTTLVRAIAEAMGVAPGAISSPTFVFVNRYEVPPGATPAGWLTHVDAYRLTSSDDLEPLGWDRLFDPATGMAAPGSIAFVEWRERIADALPPDDRLVRIDLAHTGDHSRRMLASFPDSWRERPGMDRLLEREPIRCRKTGRWVAPTDPAYPFATEQARLADLHAWFTGTYKTSREVTERDLDAGE